MSLLFGLVTAFSFLGSESVTEHDKAYFDATGTAYHQTLGDLVFRQWDAVDFHWYLPWTNGDSLQFVKRNRVRTMHCNYYGKTDTSIQESSLHPGEKYTLYNIGSDRGSARWDFDEEGRLEEYAEYNDSTERSRREHLMFEYDSLGYLKERSYYYLDDGISKQYQGNEHTQHDVFEWSADHLSCVVTVNAQLISLPGTSKAARKAWDYEHNIKNYWEFDREGRPVKFTGNYFDHECSIVYVYANGHLTRRNITFNDCKGNFSDSISWLQSDSGSVASHYCGVARSGKIKAWALFERVVYAPDGSLESIDLSDDARFGNWQHNDVMRGRHYRVTKNAGLIHSEEERDNAGHALVRKEFTYESNPRFSTTTITWTDYTPEFNGKVYEMRSYTTSNGLVTGIDLHCVNPNWWKGTYFFPHETCMDDRGCYRARYDFY